MQGTNWVKHSSKQPENGEFILFVSEGVMYVGEYEAGDLDESPVVYISDADGNTSVFYDDLEFWMPRPPMPEGE
ncbi:hypothetical protein ACIH2S_07305 [Providencia sp. PAZ2]|uniref:hypothetical protein n=1 Tax=Providencia lanzhouensis TaxID=3378099 RepID=UPI003D2CD220